MSRDDWDDDDRPRRRRRRDEDDYEDVRRRSDERSGSVTGVGVISIVLGSLVLLCGFCVMVAGLAFAGGAAGGPAGNMFPFQVAAGVFVVFAILFIIFGVLYLVGGIGVLQRRNWGRIMSLVMAGFSALFGIIYLIGIVGTLAQPGPPDSKVLGILIGLLLAGMFFTHCVMSFVVLLSSQNAAEFLE
jgi:hypothetical protein